MDTESQDVDCQASWTASDQRGELRDVGPVVNIGCGIECASGVWDWNLNAVGAVVESEDLGIFFAVLGVNEVGFRPVDIVFVACFDVASYEAVGEVRV